jgi:hypothetical protein
MVTLKDQDHILYISQNVVHLILGLILVLRPYNDHFHKINVI